MKVHISEQKPVFARFNVSWTPTHVILDSNGVEHHRVQGFLPVEDFLAQLDLALGKIHLQQEDYVGAERLFRSVCEGLPIAGASPEACYWAGVAAYKGSHEVERLTETAAALKEKFPESEWARKASVWQH